MKQSAFTLLSFFVSCQSKREKSIKIESSFWAYKSMRKNIALLRLLELFLPPHCMFFVKFPCATHFVHESSYTAVLELIFLEEILLNSYSCQHFFLQSSNCQVLPIKLQERKYFKCPVFGGGSVSKLCPTFVTPWTIACQVPLSMGLSRQEYWSELPFFSPGDLPDPGKPKVKSKYDDGLKFLKNLLKK